MKRTETVKYTAGDKGQTGKIVEIRQGNVLIVSAVLGDLGGREISREEYDNLNLKTRKGLVKKTVSQGFEKQVVTPKVGEQKAETRFVGQRRSFR